MERDNEPEQMHEMEESNCSPQMILFHEAAAERGYEEEVEEPVVFQEEQIAVASERYDSRRPSVPEAPAFIKSNLISTQQALPEMVEVNALVYESNKSTPVQPQRPSTAEQCHTEKRTASQLSKKTKLATSS